MLPNEVKSAIPRQKVKHRHEGIIADVVCVEYEEIVSVIAEFDGIKLIQEWHIRDCEPVPEEPRPFRVGSPVVFEMDGGLGFQRIAEILLKDDGTKKFRVPNGTWWEDKYFRHATPSECVRYFNQRL